MMERSLTDRQTIWTHRIIALFDRGLALLAQRNITLNGTSARELRRRIAEQRPQGGGPELRDGDTNEDAPRR